MSKKNKWTKYHLYKNGKKIDTCTKKQVNEWLKHTNLKWISREDRTLEVQQ